MGRNASAEFATMRFLLSSSGKSFEWMEELNSDALLDAMLQLRNYQLFISEGTTMDTSTLEAEICNQVEKNGIRVVVIDDLASYGPARSGTALQKYANNIAKALKQLAEKLRIVVFLTSQIERKIDRYQGILQLMPRHIQYILFGAPEVDRIIGLSRLSYHGIDYDEEGNVVQNQIRLDMLRNKSGELTSVELLYNQRMSSFLESPKGSIH